MDEVASRRFDLSVRRLARVHAEVAEVEALGAELLAMQAHDVAATERGEGIYTEASYNEMAAGLRKAAERLRDIAREL